MAKRLDANTVRLYTSDTPAGHDLYPVASNARIPRTQNGTWERRVVTGPVAADAEMFISSWTQDDYSGGFGIKDGNESTDTSRIAFGVIDGRRPKSMCLPPLTEEVTAPAWVDGEEEPVETEGSFWPLGDVGTQFYGAWENGIAGWNTATDAWHATQNAWPEDFAPVNRAVPFCGALFVPGGSEGLVALTETTAGTGTLTVSHLSTLTAVALGLHDSKLWAIDTANKLWMLTPLGAAAGATTIGNWGDVDGLASTVGTEVKDAFGNSIILDTSLTPTHLFSWFNPGQTEVLWCVTLGQSAYMFNRDEGRWIKSKVKAGAHPDWGKAADIFRDGEDLFISAGGLDLTRETVANVEVPISGPSKDQGVPPEYQGNIVDLVSERSTLYALIQGGTSVTTGPPTSSWVLQDTIGGQGGGTGQFNIPQQVAVDSSGNVYVADMLNNRVQKFTSAGVYSASISTGSGSFPQGVAVDSSGNIYVALYLNDVIRKYNSSLVLQWETTDASLSLPLYLCTDGTHVWATADTNTVRQYQCSDGDFVDDFGGSGTGNGEFTSAYGIATDGTHLYVSDRATAPRIQKFLASDHSYVTQWGSAGSDNGELNSPAGLAIDASGDVWVCDTNNNRLQRTSNTGTYQTKIAQSSPFGIAATSADVLWVTSGQHNLAKWDEETVSAPAVESKAWLGGWGGTSWFALWEGSDDLTLTWARVSMKGDYALWWGDTDGVAYRQLIPPPFFNPASRIKLGVYPFAPTGWMETFRFDANMGGWDKIASHFFAMMDYAAPDVYVDISYRTDGDQFDSGLSDPPYRTWKRVDKIGRTLARFDDTDTDPISGLPWREGEPFQWIQFRYDFQRGDLDTVSPVWMWHSLHHLSVPQDSATIVLTIPIGQKPARPKGRAPDEMLETLLGLQTTRKMVHLQTRNADPNHPEWQVFFRGRVTQVKSEAYYGADNNLAEVVTVSFVEISESSNLHTTIAVDSPT